MIGCWINEFRAKYANLRAWIKSEEGFSLEPYPDKDGNWTVGWGHLITDAVDLDRCRRGLKHLVALKDAEEAERLLDQDMTWAVNDFDLLFSSVEMTEAQRDALIAMIYQMGFPKFRGIPPHKGFQKMIAAVYRRAWLTVAAEALDSDWGRKHKKRAARTAAMLRTGEYGRETLPLFRASDNGRVSRA